METQHKWIITVGREMNNRSQAESRVCQAFEALLVGRELDVDLRRIGSFGIEPGEAVVTVYSGQDRWIYPSVTTEMVETIIETHLVRGIPILSWTDSVQNRVNFPMLLVDGNKPRKALKLNRSTTGSQLMGGTAVAPHAINSGERQVPDYAAMNLLGIGWYIAVSIILCIGGGIWLDNLFGTNHLYLLIGLMLGCVIITISIAKMVKQQINFNHKPLAMPKESDSVLKTIQAAATAQCQTEQHIKHIQEICQQERETITELVQEAVRKQNCPQEELTKTTTDLIAHAKALIAQDRADAIARLRQEYADLAISAGLDGSNVNDTSGNNNNEGLDHA